MTEICRHCHRPIHTEGDTWYHSDRYSPCPDYRNLAEPAEPTDKEVS